MTPPSQAENDSGGQNKADSSVGIIVPPPDIRSMVDKAARYVASIKPRLEQFVVRNAGMRKYSFLNGADPYHAYYQHRLSEFRAQNGPAYGNEITRPYKGLDDKNAALIELVLEAREIREEGYTLSHPIFVSPITGELVTYHGMSKHMEDPAYKEQKERLFAKIRETTLAQDDVISRCIVEVALTRPDSFGTTEEEVCNAVRESINPVLFSDWPGPKGRRLDDSLPVPKDEFLSQHSVPACTSVCVPDKGQMLEVSVESLSEQFERQYCWRD